MDQTSSRICIPFAQGTCLGFLAVFGPGCPSPSCSNVGFGVALLPDLSNGSGYLQTDPVRMHALHGVLKLLSVLSHLIFDFLHLSQAMLDLIGGCMPLGGLLLLATPAANGLGPLPSGVRGDRTGSATAIKCCLRCWLMARDVDELTDSTGFQ